MIDIESLYDIDRLWQVAREGTGRGVKVAILDTGVDSKHPDLEEAVQSTQEVVSLGRRLVCRPTTQGDAVGHGTACAGIIHSIAPEAELYSVRVIGRNSAGTIEQLVYGLRWAIQQNMDVINLSLGTIQKRQLSQLHDLVDEAYFKGQFVISAANNQRKVSYPANFASVIAVDNQSFEDPLSFHYRLGRPVELVANGIYVKAPCPGGKHRWYTGTSFACPHISGLIARLKSEIPNLTPVQIKSLLWCLRSNRDEADANKDVVESNSSDDK